MCHSVCCASDRNKDELDVPDATSIAASDITELDLRKEIKYGNRIQVIKEKIIIYAYIYIRPHITYSDYIIFVLFSVPISLLLFGQRFCFNISSASLHRDFDKH